MARFIFDPEVRIERDQILIYGASSGVEGPVFTGLEEDTQRKHIDIVYPESREMP